jgi:hypothetical protein
MSQHRVLIISNKNASNKENIHEVNVLLPAKCCLFVMGKRKNLHTFLPLLLKDISFVKHYYYY